MTDERKRKSTPCEDYKKVTRVAHEPTRLSEEKAGKH